jgi:predicted nucleic acid-binding protein
VSPIIIISDTTPLSELEKIGKLSLLGAVFGRVIIPDEVANELATASFSILDAAAILSQNWIELRPVTNQQKVLNLMKTTNLDLGECAAITLAEELQADRLILDDLAARKEAQRRGLAVIGTVGILLIAKQQGLIPSIKNVLDELIANGTRISQKLYQQALTYGGE